MRPLLRQLLPFALLLSLGALPGACATLPAVAEGSCGNAVVEPGEDCDTFTTDGLVCRPAGQTAQCRYECKASDKQPACPAGWGCGTDGVCRIADGTFDAATDVVESGGVRLASADFDGDGRIDVLSLGRPDLTGRGAHRVHYFDRDGRIARTFALPSLVASPVARDFTADGVADLVGVVGPYGSLITFAGGRDRTLTPVAYPTLTVPKGSFVKFVGADILPASLGYPGEETLIVGTFSASPGAAPVHLIAPTANAGEATPLMILSHGAADLVGPVRSGKLIESEPCPQLVFAFRGEKYATVLPSCRKTGPLPTDLALNVVLPPSLTPANPPVLVALPGEAEGPLHVADMNGDGHLDVVVGGSLAAASAVAYVAFGDGKGGFWGKPDMKGGAGASEFVVPSRFDLNEPILAVGRLDSDNIPDLVTSGGIFVSPPTGAAICASLGIQAADKGYCPVGVNLGVSWTEAVVGDFNANGFADVVVGSNAGTGVTFFSGNGAGLFATSTIATTGAVSFFSAGDYDGDLIPDLAFSQAGAHGTGVTDPGDALGILFGRRDGRPEAPVFMGRFDRIVQIAGVDLVAASGDSTTDLGVASMDEDGTEETIAISFGSADRQLLAPFGLQKVGNVGEKDVIGRPVAVAVGQFGGTDHPDLAAFAFREPAGTDKIGIFELWASLADGRAKLEAPVPSGSFPVRALEDGNPNGTIDAADLDGDGIAEVVYLGTPSKKGERGSSTSIVVSTAAGGTFTSADPQVLARYAPALGQMMLVDVDGDGALDLVLLTRDAPVDGDATAGATEVAVLWGDKKKRFDVDHPVLVKPPTAVSVTSFAILSRKGGKAIAFATADAVFVATPTARAFDVKPAGIAGGSGLAAGDVTGDGVEDLAVISDGTLRLHPGKAVLP